MKQLLERKESLLKDMNELSKRTDLSADEQAKFNKFADELTDLNKKIQFEEKREAFNAEYAKQVTKEAKSANKSEAEIRKDYEMAFRAMVMNQLTPEHREILKRANNQNTTAANGGYTIPEGFSGILEKAMAYYTPFTSDLVTDYRTATGNAVEWPTVNDTANSAYLIAEDGDQTTTATATTFSHITFKAYKFTTGMLQISRELLQDSYFNFEEVIKQLFAERMGRGLATAFTTGTGSSQPQGVVTGAGTGVTAASAIGITRADFLGLKHSVDIAYRPNAKWMLNDATFKVCIVP
jgi:HK97 family phage major capsid protein